MAGLIDRARALVAKAVQAVAVPTPRNFLGAIRESFAGAWQQNVVVDGPSTIFAQSAVYACIGGISSDIAKLRPRVQRIQDSGVWQEVDAARTRDPVVMAAIAVLTKPNPYQTRIKFIQQYIIQKLSQGNAYVLIRRSAGLPAALHVLDACRVRPMIVPTTGDVFYEVKTDNLVPVVESVQVPASEIIHDPMVCLFHPLCGVSPIYACGMTATLGNKILNNSATFFANSSRPSGILTAPGHIADEHAVELKARWEANYGNGNRGRTAILGDGLTYEAMTIPANDAQLIEQLKWTVEDIARCFHYPLYKLGGQSPTYNNIESLLQAYYSDCLQELIESFELSMAEGLGLTEEYRIELDLRSLLRMDSASRYERHNKAIAGGWFKPNDARMEENLEPVEGGEQCYMQSQNQPLARLAAEPDPAPVPEEEPLEDAAASLEETRAILDVIRRGLETEVNHGRPEA